MTGEIKILDLPERSINSTDSLLIVNGSGQHARGTYSQIIEDVTEPVQQLKDETKEWHDQTLNYVNGRFPQSLTVYVDGTSGDDTRTGTTDDANATTGRVKSLTRIAALYSGKVDILQVKVSGTLVISSDVTLEHREVNIQVLSGAVLTFSKKTIGGGFGEGQCALKLKVSHVMIYSQGTINVEAHAAPPGSSTEFNYFTNQGAVRLYKTNVYEYDTVKSQILAVLGGTINVGNYATFATTGRESGETNARAIYSSPGTTVSTTVNLGTSAVYHDLQGNRILIRSYTPSSSTDSGMSNGELTYDSNYLYGKISGTVKKIAWSSF